MMLINNNIKGKTSECIKYLLNNFSFQIQFKVYITEVFYSNFSYQLEIKRYTNMITFHISKKLEMLLTGMELNLSRRYNMYNECSIW